MSAFDNATAFFHACECGKGWAGCKDYVADDAEFSAQCEPLAEMTTIEEYTEWLGGFANGPAAGSTYDLHMSSWDEAKNSALFFGTYHAKHTGDGGPVPPTGKQTSSQYVYSFEMDGDGKIVKMIKIWNPTWALTELGWM